MKRTVAFICFLLIATAILVLHTFQVHIDNRVQKSYNDSLRNQVNIQRVLVLGYRVGEVISKNPSYKPLHEYGIY